MKKMEIKKIVILMILIQISLSVFAYLKGTLDPYLATVIPTTVMSVLLIVVTYISGSSVRYAYVNCILLSIGMLLQTLLSNKDKHLKVTISAFFLGILVTFGLICIRKLISNCYPKFVVISGCLFIFALYIVLILFAPNVNGSRSWIYLGTSSCQITEITLLLSFFMIAYILGSKRLSDNQKLQHSLLIIVINICGLVLVKEIGSLVVLLFTYATVIFIFVRDGRKVTYLLLVGLISICIVITSIWILRNLYESGWQNKISALGAEIFNKIYNRIQVVNNAQLDPYGISYQANLSEEACMLASWTGSKYEVKIPVQRSDYAYVALIARLGHLTGFITIALFVIALFESFKIYMNTDNEADKVFVAQLNFVFIWKVIFVVGGSCNLIPMSGLAVPMLGAGGTAMLINFVCVLYTVYTGKGGTFNND